MATSDVATPTADVVAVTQQTEFERAEEGRCMVEKV